MPRTGSEGWRRRDGRLSSIWERVRNLRSPTTHNYLQVFDRRCEASEDVTGTLHAATRTAPAAPKHSSRLSSHLCFFQSVAFTLEYSHQTMHGMTDAQESQAPVFMCYLSRIEIIHNPPNNLPKSLSRHQYFSPSIVLSTMLSSPLRRRSHGRGGPSCGYR